ncbi:MAG TPA: membrane assembly protein AsmA [Oleiagrimonas sp.]|nr:membrane assembly protein AsmA [Oleiagrimonas sp.]
MQRRTRLTLLAIAVFLAMIVLAAILAVYLLLQPERFTSVLRTQARQAGLVLTLSAPAEPTLWPQPALMLHGLTLSVDNRPVLVAARARLVLPWSALLGGPTTITRLELDAPRINLAQLGPVLAQMNKGKGGTPTLPHINAGIRISHGSLARGSDLLLDDIHLETGPLVPGHIFSLQLSAATADGAPTTLTLLMTPHVHDNAITLDNIHITASGPSGLSCTLDGKATWRGGADVAMTLAGTLVRSNHRTYDLALALEPATGQAPLMFHLKLEGPGLDADVDMSPSRLVDWWQTVSNGEALATGLSVPPANGTINARDITVGGTRIQGLHIRMGAAVASSAPATATSTTAKP